LTIPTLDRGNAPPDLLRYPHIQSTTTTSTVIAWVTDTSEAAEARYSTDQSYTNVVTAATDYIDDSYYHHASLTGLNPDTAYHYKIHQAGHDLTPWPDVTFVTAKEQSDPYFRFVAFGDSRDGSPRSYWVHGQMQLWDFDLLLHAGDIAHDGAYASFQREYFDVYSETIKSVPLYPAIGNHDLGDAYTNVYYLPQNAWRTDDRELYYSFDWGNAHFVSLDTFEGLQDITEGVPDQDMQEWLIDDLSHTDRFWKFVYFHIPAYSSGWYGSNPAVRDNLVAVCEDYGVDVIFASHDHNYQRTIPILDDAPSTIEEGGIVHFVTGGGGAPLHWVGSQWFTAYSRLLHHFMLAEVANCALTLRAIDPEGIVFDSLTIDRCAYTAALSLTKQGPSTARIGDTVVYSLTVVNDDVLGDGSPIQNVSVVDDLAGVATLASGDDGDDLLEVSENWVYTASYTIQPADLSPLVNTAIATGQDQAGVDVLEARDSHSTAIDYAPALTLTKSGPPIAQVSDTVVYSLTVTNDDVRGDGSPIDNVNVVDDVAGTATLVSGDDGDDLLEVGETWVYTASYVIQSTDPDLLVNTAVVTGTNQGGEDVPGASDTHGTTIDYVPALAIVKDGPATARIDDTVVYTLTVTNNDVLGDGSPIQNVSVVDDLAGAVTFVSGDDGDDLLEVGEIWVYTASIRIEATDPSPLVNTAVVMGIDRDGQEVPEVSDDHTTVTGDLAFSLFLPLVWREAG
jgi:uncharacterized repeat protein (TIGR01451 family)